MSGGNIKVVVRCRPLNARELARGAKGLIRMENDQTILEPPEVSSSSSKATGKKPQVFSFDKSYWSAGPRDEPGYASQHTLYDDLGVELLDHSFEGFNTCIFAYGQTGSGKSYSMMGYGADKGIIPLTTSELFRRVESRTATDPNLSYTVEVSYIEIYNEKVRDLLNPKNKGNLRVREHPSLGPYVEDLSRLAVENYGQMMTLMDEGNKASRARTVASTNMNETSSRSHAVFTLILTQKRLDPQSNMTGEKVSKISLVDLAGSERQASTGATGQRLKEGANINKSLTTLGKVIAALAQASSDHIKGRKKKDDFVPYRDSVLTWLLKESLGGNSKTAMIAAISPADYEETLSTLRYADAAKKIKTHAIVNEDPNAKLIRELKEELELLRSRVASGGGVAALPGGEEAVYDPTVPPEKQIVTYKTKDGEIRTVTKLELQDQLEASEKLMESLNLTWEEKMIKTQAIHVEREKALEEMGIMVDKDLVGVHAPQKHPSLVNLNEDPLMSECLVYQLKPGSTVAGSLDGSSAQIKLSGSHILPNHCIFSNEDGLVTVEAMPDARTFVNGKRVPPKSPVKLLNGFRVILGDFHVFRFNDPASVRAQRRKLNGSASVGDLSGEASASPSPGFRPDSPFRTGDGELMDWSAARREVADIEKLGDQDLDKLFDDIVKVRTLRGRPESRYDIAAELESRLLATSQTDDTQTLDTTANPWAASGAQGTTLTSNSVGTPYAPELDVSIGEQQSDTATETAPALLTYDQKAQDAALEQRHLTKQLKNLAQEVKRIRSEAAAARALEEVAIEPAHWTARELRLVQGAVERWKRLRTFAMAEQILKGAVNLREANVRAKEMGQSVSYNFLVSDGSSAAPRSSLDGLNGVVEFEDVAGPTAGGDAPLVMIKVIDREANAVFSWDLARFTQQLSKMRHLCALAAKPNYSQHFRSEGIFTDHPAPTFSFIGAAKAPLRLLASQLSCTITVPIMCQYTMEAIGSCRVDFKCSLTLTAPSSGRTTPEPPSQPVLAALSPGSRLTFTVSVDCVKGLNSEDFASVHAQTRLSSLVGPSIASEDTFASLPVDLDKTSVAHLSLKRTVTVIVTPEMTPYLREEYATIEFFAKVRPAYLSRLERWDRTREVSPPSSSPGTPLRPGETRPAMRRNETDFVQPEHHDVLAKIEIRELAADGEHYPAEVVDGVIHLHQGLQRRLFVHLTHTSGKSLPWTKLGHVSTGDVRLVDKIGQITSVAKGEVGVKLNSEVEHRPDGTSVLSGIGGWDSAAHNSIHLNRKTSGDQRLLIRLLFLVEVETLDEPAVFSMDLPIRILARDTKRSSFLTFWSANKIFTSLTSIFAVDLSPPLARSAADLWVLDTGKKHVRGEERLGDWKPRSLSLLEDWGRMRGRQKTLGDVQATRAVLGMWREPGDSGAGPGSGWGSGSESRVEDLEEPPTKSAPAAAAQEREELLKRCLHLWQQAMEYRLQVDVQRASAGEEAVARKMRRLLPDLEPKLVPTVKQLPRSESVIRSGVLMLLRDSQANQWDKLHFVLRRPYLHVHTALTEREVQVINLTRANVVASPDVEMLLERRFAFTVFTPTNSYILQAASQKDMAEWMSVIATSSDA